MTTNYSAHFKGLKLAAAVLLPVAVLALTSCSSTTPPPSAPPLAPSTYNSGSGFGGEIVTDASSRTATIVSVDRTKRLVVVKRADGSDVTYKAAPNAPGFDDIQPGDVVKVSVAEEIAVYLGKNSVPASAAADTAHLRVRLPGGTQAVATGVGIVNFTARVTAIDDWADTVTLQSSDGLTKTVHVSEFVNLADVRVGDNVSAQMTEAVALVLEKP